MGREPLQMTQLSHVPPTVNEHTPRDNGLTLHTTSQDPDKDIELYDDDRHMHLSGNPPE